MQAPLQNSTWRVVAMPNPFSRIETHLLDATHSWSSESTPGIHEANGNPSRKQEMRYALGAP